MTGNGPKGNLSVSRDTFTCNTVKIDCYLNALRLNDLIFLYLEDVFYILNYVKYPYYKSGD